MKEKRFAGLVVAAALISAPTLSGASVILFQNALGPDADLAGGNGSFTVPGTLLAENFMLTGKSSIDTLVFDAYHRILPTPEAADPFSIDWSIRPNVAGNMPGDNSSLLASGNAAPFSKTIVESPANDPQNSTDYQLIDYSVNVVGSSIVLGPGQYWVTFHVNVPLDPNPPNDPLEQDPAWTLAKDSGNPNAYDSLNARSDDNGDHWTIGADDMVFRIEGTPVPLPATLSLLGLGLGLLGAQRRLEPVK